MRGTALASDLRLEWFEGLESFTEPLESAWRDLESRTRDRSVFVTYDWLTTWYRWYGEFAGTALLGTARAGTDLVGIAPLATWGGTLGRVPVRRIDLAGHNGGAGEFLVADDRPGLVRLFLDGLLERTGIDAVVLNGFVPGSPELESALEVAARHRWASECVTYHYANVDLSEGFEAYCRAKGSNFRRNLRRHAARIRESGKHGVDRLAGKVDREDLAAFMDRIFAIAARSWKARGGPPAPRHRGFYLELAQRFAARGELDLSILTIGGRDAAYILAMVERGVYYDGTISFDESFAPHSPGTFLMLEVLRTLPERGIHRVVSHGDHEYKRRWATEFLPLVRAFLFAPGARGAAARLARFQLPRTIRGVMGARHSG